MWWMSLKWAQSLGFRHQKLVGEESEPCRAWVAVAAAATGISSNRIVTFIMGRRGARFTNSTQPQKIMQYQTAGIFIFFFIFFFKESIFRGGNEDFQKNMGRRGCLGGEGYRGLFRGGTTIFKGGGKLPPCHHLKKYN